MARIFDLPKSAIEPPKTVKVSFPKELGDAVETMANEFGVEPSVVVCHAVEFAFSTRRSKSKYKTKSDLEKNEQLNNDISYEND